jgi:hypothetical protein
MCNIGSIEESPRERSNSCSQAGKCFSSKWVIGAGMITGLAVAVLGALALVGIFYPTSPLGVLGGTFGQIGTFVTLGAGLFLFGAIVIALVVRSCCSKTDGKGSDEIPDLETDGGGSKGKPSGLQFVNRGDRGGGNPKKPKMDPRNDSNVSFE